MRGEHAMRTGGELRGEPVAKGFLELLDLEPLLLAEFTLLNLGGEVIEPPT